MTKYFSCLKHTLDTYNANFFTIHAILVVTVWIAHVKRYIEVETVCCKSWILFQRTQKDIKLIIQKITGQSTIHM